MIAIVTVLAAFPLGYFLRSRVVASLVYAVAYLWAFTFQTLYLVLDSFKEGNKDPVFLPDEFPWQYGVVTLAILVVGVGVVEVGHRVGQRRRVGAQDALLT